MGGSSNSTGAAGGAPIPLLTAENSAFGSIPFSNINSASGSANAGINALNTNPGAQYGAYTGAGGYDQQLANSGQSAIGAGNGVISNLFNNQQGYYNQLFNQNQQQSNAENAMAGVATTPYGASLTNQSDQNFNNSWQSFLNGQQATGANTAASLFGTGSSLLGTGLQQGQSIDSQNYNAQQGSIQDFLNYISGNASNASSFFGAQNQTYGDALSGASLNNTAAQQSNAALSSELSGLGSLAGSGLKFGAAGGFSRFI